MSLTIVIILIVALVLIYSAVRGQDPRDVLKKAIRKG